MAFNPDQFGFTIKPTNGVAGRGAIDVDYLRIRHDKSGNVEEAALVLCKETAELAMIIATVHLEIGVRMNEMGQLLLCDASPRRKLRIPKGASGEISINGLRREIAKAHGTDWKRLYLQAKPYAGGEAILLVPNGERDVQ